MSGSRVRCFWMYSLVVILLTTIPYVWGFAAQDTSSVFSGFVFGVEDGNSYVAKMQLGTSGDWLFRTSYTAQPQSGVLAFLPYILLGKLAADPELHLQLVVLFHLFRIAVIPLAIWATYRFIAYFISDQQWAAWATVLATVGSGLGWLLVLFDRSTLQGSIPLGFISPETFGFLAYFGLPHLVLARALLLIALRWYLESSGKLRKAWQAGFMLAALGIVQPLTLLPAYAVIGAHQMLVLTRAGMSGLQVWKRRWGQPLVRMLCLSLPVFIYYVLVFSTDPFLQLWTEQNKILSPHPIHYLLAYALIIPWLIPGLMHAWTTDNEQLLFPMAWIGLIPFLAYAPYNLQRRLPEGSWIALVLLAAVGLSRIGLDEKLKSGTRVIVLIFSLVTPLLLVYGGIQVASTKRLPAFREEHEIKAFEWLSENVEARSVILTSFETGNALPAWAPMRVVIGHGPESANLAELRPAVQTFFSGQLSEDIQAQFLREQQVEYLFYGPVEREMGKWDPGQFTGMQAIYETEEYSIYQFSGDQ